jgi:hypothetical protein
VVSSATPSSITYYWKSSKQHCLLYKLLVDAEQKQFNDLPVKQWLDDLKGAIFDSEDLLNLISYDALQCKVENTPVVQLQNLSSSIFNCYLYDDINMQS